MFVKYKLELLVGIKYTWQNLLTVTPLFTILEVSILICWRGSMKIIKNLIDIDLKNKDEMRLLVNGNTCV